MNFIDIEHEEFFEEKMKELRKLGKTDVYYINSGSGRARLTTTPFFT